MSTTIYGALLARVKRGDRLSSAELEDVRNELSAARAGADPYTLIHILWKSRDETSRPLVASSIASGDEMVRKIALQALAELWPSPEIHKIACQLLRDDPSKYVRMAAATVVGDLGAAMPERASQSAQVLLGAFDSMTSARGPEWEACYEGLLNLLRIPAAARPAAARPLSMSELDPTIVEKARAIARNKGAGWAG
jgi:HEAT repeat protein